MILIDISLSNNANLLKFMEKNAIKNNICLTWGLRKNRAKIETVWF